jgi:hypothetical protein
MRKVLNKKKIKEVLKKYIKGVIKEINLKESSDKDVTKIAGLIKDVGSLFDMKDVIRKGGYRKVDTVSTPSGYAVIVDIGSKKVVVGTEKVLDVDDDEDIIRVGSYLVGLL